MSFNGNIPSASSRSAKIPIEWVTVWGLTYSGWFIYIKWLTGKEELYDNNKDPFQLNNIVEDEGSVERTNEFRKEMNILMTGAGDDFLPGNACAKWFNEKRYPEMEAISVK